jgi:hypothetical protein
VRRRLLLALAACPAALAIAPGTAQQPAAPPLVRVAAISPWIAPDRPFSLTVQITNATELTLGDLSVRVSVFGRVGSRGALREALDRAAPTPALGGTTEPVPGTIAPGEQRTVVVTRDAGSLGTRLSRTGVYPILITLRHSGGHTAVRTAVPFLATLPLTRINLVWSVPVSRPTVRPPDGIYADDAVQRLALEELAQQMETLAARPGAAVTLAPDAGLLDTLADMADGFAQREGAGVEARGGDSPGARRAAEALGAIARAARASAAIATRPYAPVDPSTLAARGLRSDLLRQLTLGRSVVQARRGRAPSLNAFAPPRGALDQTSLQTLAPLGIGGVVIAPSSLREQPSTPFSPDNFGPSRPVALALDESPPVPALLLDEPLAARIDQPEEGGVLLGQAIVAESASAWLELPAFADERVIAIGGGRAPSPGAFGAALDGLRTAPWVRMRSVSEALAALPPQTEPLGLLRRRPRDRSYLEGARNARRLHEILRSIAVGRQEEIDTLDRLVLLSQSQEWERDHAGGLALARAVTARTRAVLRQIRVAPRQVTLTSRRGQVPVTLLNGNDFPVTVRVRLESAKVAFPDGAARTVELPPPARTFDFPVEARAAGSFPVDVHVESPDGGPALAEGRLVLRSTAVSAVALAVVASGLVLLLFGGAGRGARRRRSAPGG